MKKLPLFLLVLIPALLSFQCEEEFVNRFQTNLVVTNDSSFDLVLETIEGNLSAIQSQESLYIDGYSAESGFILPSEFTSINSIKLYKRDDNQNLILVYNQSPLNDDLWIINQSTGMDVDYVLTITDDNLSQ